MKRKLGVLMLIGALMLTAAPVWADGDFYVIGGGGGVGTRISSLPYPITNSGFYYLGGNLTCASGTAITVSANNVTLDLMGFTLTGNTTSGSNGILIGGSRNVEIRNGTIHGCYTGIYGYGGNNRVISVKASYCAALAMELDGVGNLFQNCSAFNTGPTAGFISCMYLQTGTITGCISINNNIGGIGMSGPGLVTNNTANSNGNNGFNLGNNIYVNGNVALSNTGVNYSAGTTGMVWGMNAGGPPHMNNPTPYSVEPPASQSGPNPGDNNLNVR